MNGLSKEILVTSPSGHPPLSSCGSERETVLIRTRERIREAWRKGGRLRAELGGMREDWEGTG